jgi:hypothetical protein
VLPPEISGLHKKTLFPAVAFVSTGSESIFKNVQLIPSVDLATVQLFAVGKGTLELRLPHLKAIPLVIATGPWLPYWTWAKAGQFDQVVLLVEYIPPTPDPGIIYFPAK